jgi:serpin B
LGSALITRLAKALEEELVASLFSWIRGLLGGKADSTSEFSSAEPRARPGELSAFAEHQNDFALTLYGELGSSPGNLFFSPFSVRVALCMAFAGARGETAAQMRDSLGIASSDRAIHGAFAKIIERLNEAGGGEYEMAVANSLWGQDGADFRTEFLDLVNRHYGGGMNIVDFRRDAEAARVRINRWVEDQTKEKIRDVIPSGELDPNTRFMLVNAVYFKGLWVLPFRKAATRDEPFYLETGGMVQAPLMRQKERVRYSQDEGFQAIELAYRGADLSMLVLLPGNKDGLPNLEKRLSARMLNDCVAKMRERKIELFLPRFEMTWGTANLTDELRTLGMPLALTRGQADFSGMNGLEPPDDDSLFIDSVWHKAFVEVNEEGTEAAAATAVTMGPRSAARPPPPVPIFRADHPFLFAIRDRKSGAILFLGRIIDPRLMG